MPETIQAKPVKVFTRDEPCSKVDILNCFHQGGGYTPRAVVETQGEIGVNAPKYLIKQGYMRTFNRNWVDYQELTEAGKRWLEAGLRSLVKRDPTALRKLNGISMGRMLGETTPTVKRITRTKR